MSETAAPAEPGHLSTPVPATMPTAPTGTVPGSLVAAVISYLILLLAFGALYFSWPALQTRLPSSFGPIPLAVPWWGALGAVIGSLYGIFFHNQNWKCSYDIWHYTRPLVGAAMGMVAFFAYLLLVAVSGSKASSGGSIAYYLAAFVVGNSDALFHQLIQKISGTLFSSKDSAPAPTS